MKITYIMNVDWDWIKQRPHFLAEELAKHHDVTVFFQKRYSRNGYQKNDTGDLKVVPIYVIPRGDRYSILSKLNVFIKQKRIQTHIKKSGTECVYTTYPDQLPLLKNFDGTVIYDCMDNHPAFVENLQKREMMIAQESELVQRAQAVLCSSEKLKSVISDRYGSGIQGKIHVVRNGYSGNPMKLAEEKAEAERNKFVIAYFGTISSWLNFDFILQSVKDFENIEYRLFGPVAGVEIPDSPGIKYMGTVEHSELYRSVRDVQCLVMPFVVNEIIESVDPVKLYEYINFNKNILCVRYDEVQRFENFVFFYDDYASYKRQIESMMKLGNVKYTLTDREKFLSENNWRSRASRIMEIL